MWKGLLNRPLYRGLTLNLKRYFDLHEYQSKDLMRKYNILVQKGDIATTPEQAFNVAKKLNVTDGDLILKAQVQAGGRGKGILLLIYRYINKRFKRWCSNSQNSITSERFH